MGNTHIFRKTHLVPGKKGEIEEQQYPQKNPERKLEASDVLISSGQRHERKKKRFLPNIGM